MNQSLTFAQIINYLEVGLTQADKALLAFKLENAASHDRSCFANFPKELSQKFIAESYNEIWQAKYCASAEYQEALRLELERRLANAKTPLECEQATLLAKAKLQKSVQNHYQNHLDAIQANDGVACAELNQEMLAAFAKQQGLTVADFLQHEQQRYLGLANTLEKLGKVIVRLEGHQTVSTPDLRRWAQYLAQAEQEEVQEQVKGLKIGVKRGERAESIEHWAEVAGVVLKVLSIGLAIFSLSTSAVSFLSEETVKEGVEEATLSTESCGLLVMGIILCLKGESQLGMTYIGLGMTNVLAEIITSIADFGPHFMNAASSASVIAFVGSMCCFAMAFINHKQMKQALGRCEEIEKQISLIEQDLQLPSHLDQKKAHLVEQAANISDKHAQLLVDKGHRKTFEADYARQKSIVSQATLSYFEQRQQHLEITKSLTNHRAELDSYQAEDAKLVKQLSELGSQDSDKLNAQKAMIEAKRNILKAKIEASNQQVLHYQSLDNESQQKLALLSKQEQVEKDILIKLERSAAASLPDSKHLTKQLAELEQELQRIEHIELPKVEVEKLTAVAKLEELQAQKKALTTILFSEQALIKDKRLARNMMIANGVILATAAILSVVMASIASAGVLPIVLVAVAGLSLGLAFIKRCVIGRDPYTNNIKNAHKEIETFNNIVEHQSQLKENLSLSDEQFSKLQAHLHQRILKSVKGEAQILDLLEQLSEPNLSHIQSKQLQLKLITALQAQKGENILQLLKLEHDDSEAMTEDDVEGEGVLFGM